MARLWFDPPVSIEGDRPGLIMVISSVERAAEQLLTWGDRGPNWRGAVQACMDAMNGRGTADQARAAFIAAAEESGKLSQVMWLARRTLRTDGVRHLANLQPSH